MDDLSPIVSTYANFDSVLVPADHVSRSANDTYYVTKGSVLRCHTSAHQLELLKHGHKRFLVTGDVYRRDTIDATHFPVFHQVEVLAIDEGLDFSHLRGTVMAFLKAFFGDLPVRFRASYFPFTEPSAEVDVLWRG